MSKIKLKTTAGPTEAFAIPVTAINLHGQEVEVIFQCRPRGRREWAPIYKGFMADELHPTRAKAEAAKTALEQAVKAPEGAAEDEGEPDQMKKLDDIIAVVDEFDKFDAQDGVEKGLKRQAEIAQIVAEGWDLEDEFGEAALVQLEDMFPGIVQELLKAYSQAINGARVKN